jgi:hypothetical protein
MKCLHLKSGECCARKFGGRICQPCDACDLPKPVRLPHVPRNPPPLTPIQSISRNQWPLAVKGIASLAQPADRGIGDIVERMAKLAGGKTLAQWYKDLTGRDCGCADRKDRLNRMYPLRDGGTTFVP